MLVMEGDLDLSDPPREEEIYIAFDEVVRWIMVYETDIDFGILFSDNPPDILIPGVDISDGDRQFVDTCRDWLAGARAHYEPLLIQQWLKLRTEEA
jgi:hypothetical protein